MPPNEWGWNCREHSYAYLAVEFAQPTVDHPINDDQVRAFAWYFVNILRRTWPSLPATFPAHSELPAGIRDGKTDAFPNGDTRNDDLRARILAHIAYFSG